MVGYCHVLLRRDYSGKKMHLLQMNEIETTHLFLRCPIKEDNFTLGDLWRNKKVREFLGGIVSEDLIEQKIVELQNHWELHQFGLWTVYEKNSNLVAGLCGLHNSEDGIEISYMFFPQFWGQGFASEAVFASIDNGFNTIKIDEIIAITQKANLKSCRLLDKLGMKHIKTFERFNATQVKYRLLRTQWRNNFICINGAR
ncbi:TPA: GNAT family N-acetyltransferase [Legionella pneumophila subsp. pneumophila]|nr:GNAT family N-acetyltransferase [Legionella pneumophila subsp. pneumophila]HAU0937187.1 GNAT family N-acetyltransferase [Legionella pneumophila]HAU1689054.1 GNAT family N-acetyltransferase [Legionella pneumophila]